MKRLFYVASLLLCLSVLFSSCEKSGTENKKNEESPIVGCWISDYYESESHQYDHESDKNNITAYSEFTNTGLLKVYSKDYSTDENATFKDGVLSYPGGGVGT